jgi:iron(III) transport system permease protein
MSASVTLRMPAAGCRRRIVVFVPFAALLSLAVAALIIYPLVRVVAATFFAGGTFDATPIYAALHEPALVRLLLNTLAVVISGTAIAVLIGSAFAWLSERTDMGLTWLTRVLPIVPLLVPPVAGAIGWVLLAAPTSGFLNVWMRAGLSHIGIDLTDGPLSVFSWPGLIFVYVLYLVPEIYLVVAAGLRNLDPALEEAARMNGSGPWTTLRRVTLPSVKPTIAAGAVLALLTGFALFSVPVIIGPQAGIDILSVRVVNLMTSSYPPKTGVAMTLGLLVLAVTGSAWWMQSRLLRGRHHAVIGGRGVRVASVRLGRWRIVARAMMLAYLLLTSVLPLLALLVVSLQPFWNPMINFGVLSLRHYQRLFSDDFSRNALRNSVLLGIVGATAGTLIAAVIAFFIDRGRSGLLARLVDGTTKLPGAVSHLIIGIAFVSAFAGPPFGLSGTVTMLFLAYLVLFMPQATFNATAALAQIGRELPEASLMSGASQGMTFLRVTLPLMLPGLAAAWVLLFVMMSGEITASSMLAGTGNPVVGFVVLDLWSNGSYTDLAAYGALMSLLNSTVVLLTLRFTRAAAVG